MKGNLIGDTTIRDLKEAEGISNFALPPLGEAVSSKNTSSQNIPLTSEKFLEMFWLFKILFRFIGGKKSAIAIQSMKLNSNFKKVKINLREFFMAHKENSGQYLWFIIYNLIFNMLSDIIAKVAPSTDHLQIPDGLSPQPTTNWYDHPNPYKNQQFLQVQRDTMTTIGRNEHFKNNNNQIPNFLLWRSVGEYVIEDGKDYSKFFSGPDIVKHQPPIPEVKGNYIHIIYSFFM